MTLSSHVLDASRGRPAEGVAVRWDHLDGEAWVTAGRAVTGADGRVAGWGEGTGLRAGTHRLVFASGDYFSRLGSDTFFPEVVVVFEVGDPAQRLHVPLLLGPYSYSTYRGS